MDHHQKIDSLFADRPRTRAINGHRWVIYLAASGELGWDLLQRGRTFFADVAEVASFGTKVSERDLSDELRALLWVALEQWQAAREDRAPAC